MRLIYFVAVIGVSSALVSQTPANAPIREPRALQIASASVAASGVSLSSHRVIDVTQTGTIAYNWANQAVEGAVKILEIGTTDVRLDASLPTGNYRWFASDGRGKTERADGHAQAIPYHCGIAQAALTLPILRLAEAVNNPDYELHYLGVIDNERRQFRIEMKNVAGRNDAERVVSALDSAEFVIDAQSYEIVQLKDLARSESDMFNSVPRILTFSDYRSQDGVQFPFSVEEDVNGAHTWKLQVESVQLNTGINRSSITF